MQRTFMTLRMIEAPDRNAARDQVLAFGKDVGVRAWSVLRVVPERWSADDINTKLVLEGSDPVRRRWEVTVGFLASDEEELDNALEVTGLVSEAYVWASHLTPSDQIELDLWDDMVAGDPDAITYGIHLAAEHLKAAYGSHGELPDLIDTLDEIDELTALLRERL